MSHPAPRAPRSETREIAELKRLKTDQPELGSAVDMQLALVEMQRRVQSRVPLPWISADAAWLQAQQQAGHALQCVSEAQAARQVPGQLEKGWIEGRVTATGGAWDGGFRCTAFLEADLEQVEEEPGAFIAATTERDDGVIFFTSGTSDRPKGVVLSYREQLRNIVPMTDGFGISAADRIYAFRSFN